MGEQINNAAVKEKPLKFPLSFKKSEKDLFDWCMSKRNYSGYVKDLIEADMLAQARGEQGLGIITKAPVKQATEPEPEPVEDIDNDPIHDIINGIPE